MALPPGEDLSRRDFLGRSCGLFAASLLAANGLTLAACDSAAGASSGVSTDATGVAVTSTTVTIDLALATSLEAIGGGLLIPSAKVLVVHAATDDYRAFSSVCPHERGTIRQVVWSGSTSEIRCSSHGWTFDLTGAPTGRATRSATRYAVVQDGPMLTIATA
jgi:nitrite reductase/ring-hydroxylating ferredoxin subunit